MLSSVSDFGLERFIVFKLLLRVTSQTKSASIENEECDLVKQCMCDKLELENVGAGVDIFNEANHGFKLKFFFKLFKVHFIMIILPTLAFLFITY